MRRHCWLKLWLMYVASMARFRGEFRELPSSWGGSFAVSLTVSRSDGDTHTHAFISIFCWASSSWRKIEIVSALTKVGVVSLVEEELVSDTLHDDVPGVYWACAAHQRGQDGIGGKDVALGFSQLKRDRFNTVTCGFSYKSCLWFHYLQP